GRIYGVVRRSDTNAPVAGAHVGVFAQGYGLTDGYTDSQGRFDFAKVPAGFVTLLASEWGISRQAVSLDFDLRADEVKQSDMIISVLDPAEKPTTLTGQVLREKLLAPGTYEPAAGALVKIGGYKTVTADALGNFRYDDIPVSFSQKNITAYDPSTQRVKAVQIPTLTEAGPNTMSIVIGAFDRGYGTVRVRLVNAGGIPVSGYRVIVPGFPPDRLDDKGNGVYELPNVPVGTSWNIWAVPPGPRNIGPNGDKLDDSRPYGDQTASGHGQVLFDGHVAAVTLRLPGEGTVRVKVRSQFDLITPVALSYPAWDENEQGMYGITLKASTEKLGEADWAVFPKIPAMQTYGVTSLHPQYGYASQNAQLFFDGDFRDHILQLNTLATVRGTVYAIDGLTPIAGASVRIFNGRSDPGPQITGPDGRFEFRDQPSATGVTVTAEVTQSDIYRTGYATATTPPNGGVVEGMSVVMRKRGFVDGRVVYKDYKVFDPNNALNNVPDNTPNDYSDNAPVPLARFYLRELDFPNRDFGKNTAPLITDNTGRFLINGVFVGALRATAWDSSNEELRGDWTGSITEEGAEATPKAYIAIGGGGVGEARITVVDPNQSYAEVPNAEVGLYRGGARFDFTSTDGTGVASFAELPVGVYNVSAYSKALGKTSQSESITITRDGIATARLRLEFSGMVDGHFVDPEANDKPVAGAAIRLTAANYSSQASTDVAGAFTFLGVREGSFRLEAKDTQSNRRATADDAISILDPHRTVTLKLEPTETLRVGVYQPDDFGKNSGTLAPIVTMEVKQRCYFIAFVEHCEYRRELQGNPIDFTQMFKNEPYAVTVREIGGKGRVIGTGDSFPNGTVTKPISLWWPAYGDVHAVVTQGGLPAQNVKVTISGSGKGVIVYTDSDGKASAYGMPLGGVYVQAESIDGRFTGGKALTLAQQSVPVTAEIALGTYAGVTGTVIAEGGAGPSVGTRVVAHFAGNTADMRTDGSGKFTILGIPAVSTGTAVDLTFIGPDDTTFGASRRPIVYPDSGVWDVGQVPIDATPPQLESIIPADGATNVSPDAKIKILFSEPLNTDRINTGTVQLVAADGSNAAYTLAWADEPGNKFSITISPTKPATGFPLRSNTLYRVVISGQLTDVTGHPLPSDRGFSFTTTDYAEPRVLKALPASPIKKPTTFEFRFNEPINPAPWQPGGTGGVFHIYKLAAPGGPGAAILLDMGGRAFVDPATYMTLYFAPDESHPIEPESFYRVVFSGVTDPQGNVTPEQTFHFFSYDEVAPVAVFVSPVEGAQLVSGSEYELKLELHNGSTSGTIATDVKKVEFFTVAA
ncbi:MAG TPA: Ig-like domain-containing protein, partial [Thermoanaerobaculia bacterium]|nr:Ig-like domain-containing protein [Thermoanaerobaculia bacterium]